MKRYSPEQDRKKRIEWVDIAKFIGIFFVMLSHFESCPSFLREFFTPFYLAIFFFCSGFTYRHKEGFFDFFKKKVRQLVLPWFIYSNLNIILSNILSFKEHASDFKTELFRNLLQIRYYDERLWFIPALFSAYLVFYFVIRWYEKKQEKGQLLLLCAVLAFLRKIYKQFMDPELLPWKLINLPWHIDYIPTAMLFMVLGYLFRDTETSFDEKLDWKKKLLIVAAYLFLVYYPYVTGVSFAWFLDFFYDHICHILGIILVVMAAKKTPANRLLLYIGSNTLIYFCLHNKAITALEACFRHFVSGPYQSLAANPLLSALFCFAMTAVVALILLIPTMFINRYLPWTVGRTASRKDPGQ
ncbi:MAG: acyltransferase family protein [Erysipelotrichaceae bacterium]|nr:acyltransferase family protein [Erysipelotrichaceae bacterium]